MTRDEESSITGDAFQELKKKSIAGMGALFIRQILVKVIFFAGNIILARILAPEVFGIYAIVNFVVTFFSTFGDVGIGAALIQKKGELSKEELSTTFWLQQMLVWTVVAIAIAAAPLALKIYPTLPPVGVWLIRAMALSFLFSSLKTIPAILMERGINFKRIAWVDITENLAFQAVAISCALSGLGAWSFILAAITRALLGAAIIFALSPWRPSFVFRYGSVQGLVRFGIPYQSNQILNFMKDAVTPLFVGAYVGAAAVGYLNWARNLAFAPLMVSESFGRVAFPAFAKLQDDKEMLGRTIERSIRVLTLLMCPTTAIMVALGPEITEAIFTNKWLPGINAYYLYCFTPLLIGITMPMATAILSLGKSPLILAMTILLIGIEWGIGIPAVIKYGYTGVALTQPISYILFIWIYMYVLSKHDIKLKLTSNVKAQFMVSVVICLLLSYLKCYLIVNVVTVISQCILGYILFAIGIFMLRKDLYLELKFYFNHARR